MSATPPTAPQQPSASASDNETTSVPSPSAPPTSVPPTSAPPTSEESAATHDEGAAVTGTFRASTYDAPGQDGGPRVMVPPPPPTFPTSLTHTDFNTLPEAPYTGVRMGLLIWALLVAITGIFMIVIPLFSGVSLSWLVTIAAASLGLALIIGALISAVSSGGRKDSHRQG